MPSKLGFYPPKLNQTMVRLTQKISPWLASWWYCLSLKIDLEDLKKLEALKHQRLILLPNHPSFHDPIIMFLLSARLNRYFYYLTAFETFEDPGKIFMVSSERSLLEPISQWGPIKSFLRKVFQRCGMYSVHRGLTDRASIGQTWHLLEQKDSCLVIFPEGGCSYQNDTVMPFREGGIQMAFQSLKQANKRGQELEDLYAVALTIKYRYKDDMSLTIKESLSSLELKLALPSLNQLTDYERLVRIAGAVLKRLEIEYGIKTQLSDSRDLNRRINALRNFVIGRCEAELGITDSVNKMMRERVYRVQHHLQTQSMAVDSSIQWSRRVMEKAMGRLLNFDAIYDGYVAENQTQERFLDTLIRLEREVFEIDQPLVKGFRTAEVKVGEVFNLKDHFANYQRQRVQVVTDLNSQLQRSVQSVL